MMLTRLRDAAGGTGAALLVVLAVCLAGTAAAWLLAPIGPIPLIGIVTILTLPFPTGLAYMAAICALYFAVRLAVRRKLPDLAILFLAGASVFSAAWAIPTRWNAEQGLSTPAEALAPVALPRDGRLALVNQGWGTDWVYCQQFCLALLLSGKVESLAVAQSEFEPEPLKPLPGIVIRPRGAGAAESRACLRGREDYSIRSRSWPEDRHRDFAEGAGGSRIWQAYVLPCFDIERGVTVDPAAQLTIVNFSLSENTGGPKEGLELRRIVEPRAGRPPLVREARGRWVQAWMVPLAIWPFAGNAASGGRFEPSFATVQAQSMAFHPEVERNWWSMVIGGELLLDQTPKMLDGVLASGQSTFDTARDPT